LLHWAKIGHRGEQISVVLHFLFVEAVYFQGHRSRKTTEIYKHASTKSLQKITSPFDYL